MTDASESVRAAEVRRKCKPFECASFLAHKIGNGLTLVNAKSCIYEREKSLPRGRDERCEQRAGMGGSGASATGRSIGEIVIGELLLSSQTSALMSDTDQYEPGIHRDVPSLLRVV